MFAWLILRFIESFNNVIMRQVSPIKYFQFSIFLLLSNLLGNPFRFQHSYWLSHVFCTWVEITNSVTIEIILDRFSFLKQWVCEKKWRKVNNRKVSFLSISCMHDCDFEEQCKTTSLLVVGRYVQYSSNSLKVSVRRFHLQFFILSVSSSFSYTCCHQSSRI